MNDGLVVLDRVARTYGHGATAVVAVHDVSCVVTARSRIALVGPSGSGKSTLVQLMAGLDEPTSGTVAWPRWPEGPRHDPSRAGVVFQGASLIPSLSAEENVAFPLLLRKTPYQDALHQARNSLALLRLQGLADRTPDELSGGQAQRVAVARVVTSAPELILADEPTGRLDRASADRVIDVLLEAADHLGAGLVVATHDPEVVQRLEESWLLRDGALLNEAAA